MRTIAAVNEKISSVRNFVHIISIKQYFVYFFDFSYESENFLNETGPLNNEKRLSLSRFTYDIDLISQSFNQLKKMLCEFAIESAKAGLPINENDK